jgi:hypothetical protein
LFFVFEEKNAYRKLSRHLVKANKQKAALRKEIKQKEVHVKDFPRPATKSVSSAKVLSTTTLFVPQKHMVGSVQGYKQ